MIEILVSLLILTIVLLGLAALQIFAIRQVTGSKRANEATRLGQMVIERYQQMRTGDITTTLDWNTETNQDGQPMSGVGADGKPPGPYTVDGYIEAGGLGGTSLMITVRVTWLDLSPGPGGAGTYQNMHVFLNTMRSP